MKQDTEERGWELWTQSTEEGLSVRQWLEMRDLGDSGEPQVHQLCTAQSKQERGGLKSGKVGGDRG